MKSINAKLVTSRAMLNGNMRLTIEVTPQEWRDEVRDFVSVSGIRIGLCEGVMDDRDEPPAPVAREPKKKAEKPGVTLTPTPLEAAIEAALQPGAPAQALAAVTAAVAAGSPFNEESAVDDGPVTFVDEAPPPPTASYEERRNPDDDPPEDDDGLEIPAFLKREPAPAMPARGSPFELEDGSAS